MRRSRLLALSLLLPACSSDGGLKTYNAAPKAAILTPAPNEQFWEYDTIALQAQVSDNATPAADLTVLWSANSTGKLTGAASLDGDISSLLLTDGLAAGDWTITVQVIDEDGATGDDAVAISVVENVPPHITLVSPAEGARFAEGVSVPISALVTDVDAGSNEELSLTWAGDAEGNTGAPTFPAADGYASFDLSDLPTGNHAVSVVVTDAAGDASEANVTFEVYDLDRDDDGYATADDCDDDNATVNAGAPEICDGVDNDCDGTIDVGADDRLSWYADTDGDGYGGGGVVEACDQPAGYAATADDCDDANEAINPGADELCNGMDDDCDGLIDGSAIDAATWYLDADGDGYGDDASALSSCRAPAGYVSANGDCDDGDTAYHPGASESDCSDPNDYNCDGSSAYSDIDGDGFVACEDCDDSDSAVNSSALEVCDGVDNDCDTVTDEDDAADALVWYEDADSDGYGGSAASTMACDEPAGYAATDDDCDDGISTIYPGAAETCDGVDQDCDGTIDNSPTDPTTWYADLDGDAYGDAASSVAECDAPVGYVALAGDCDDGDARYNPAAAEMDCSDPNDYNCDGTTGYSDADADGYAACEECDDADAAVNPGEDEYCDGFDNNCNGDVDEDSALDALLWYADDDLDGYGGDTTTFACDAPAGYTVDTTDCDDADAAVYPGAVEHCDDIDEDCDGAVDEGAVDPTTWYVDGDSDGYGTGATVSACDQPAGYAPAGDCDDTDAAYNPSASESDCADPNDYNCDGTVAYADTDADGWAACEECDDGDASVNPDAAEYCNGTDDNCDGTVDEATAVDAHTSYRDSDADSYGAASVTYTGCTTPAGYVANASDCDDADSDTFPGSSPIDSPTACMNDDDGDNYGDTTVSGAVVAGTDCDDAAPAVYPSRTEVVNDGLDQDCDAVDSCYYDADDDNFGVAIVVDSADLDCADARESTVTTDCDDIDADTFPGAAPLDSLSACMNDDDGDNFGDTTTSGSVTAGTDCNDASASVYVGRGEVVNDGIDQDCDSVDSCYYDADNDNYGVSTVVDSADLDCADALEATVSSDCDDTDAGDYPGAAETVANSDDEDCDGVDSCYTDSDSDNYGTTVVIDGSSLSCTTGSGAAVATDCDDANALVSPAATEICDNGIDDNCDGAAGTCGLAGSIDASLADAKYEGEDPGDNAGYSVAFAGDSDGDGGDDLLVGSISASSTTSDDGRAYLILTGSIADDALADSYGQLAGDESDTNLGISLDGGFDFDGDGDDDQIVGASEADGNAGSGNDAGEAYLLLGLGSSSSSWRRETSFLGDSTDDECGHSVSGLQDFDGDGRDELAVGCDDEDDYKYLCGEVHIFEGDSSPSSTRRMDRDEDANIFGSSARGRLGTSLANGGDLDGDGLGDLIIGASLAGGYAGGAYAFFGPISGSVYTSGADVTMEGAGTYTYFGEELDSVADSDGDGYGEILVGVQAAGSTDAGAAYLFDATTGVNLETTDATVTIVGTSAADYVGSCVASGDIDGDGDSDLIVGAIGIDVGGASAGAVYLFLAPLSGTLALSDADGVLVGESVDDAFGVSCAAKGDANGDGFDDVLVGGTGDDDGGGDAGAAWLFLGGGL